MFKDTLFMSLVFMFIVSVILTGLFYSFDKAENAAISEKPTQTDTITVKEENKTQTKTDEQLLSENPDKSRQLYRMLDFDRRLILKVGQQKDEMCSVYSIAYAKAIVDNDFSANPLDYWDDGAIWRNADLVDLAGNNSLDKVLQIAYDEINQGRPTIIYVEGHYADSITATPQQRESYMHYVTIIGYRLDADYKNLKPSDFYGVDASVGYSDDSGFIPWVTLSDTGPHKTSGEYSLYGFADTDKHASTCVAYEDASRW